MLHPFILSVSRDMKMEMSSALLNSLFLVLADCIKGDSSEQLLSIQSYKVPWPFLQEYHWCAVSAIICKHLFSTCSWHQCCTDYRWADCSTYRVILLQSRHQHCRSEDKIRVSAPTALLLFTPSGFLFCQTAATESCTWFDRDVCSEVTLL